MNTVYPLVEFRKQGVPARARPVLRTFYHDSSTSAPLAMDHQQSQAIVPLRGKRCTSSCLTGAFAPEPHACFAGLLVQRVAEFLSLSSFALH